MPLLWALGQLSRAGRGEKGLTGCVTCFMYEHIYLYECVLAHCKCQFWACRPVRFPPRARMLFSSVTLQPGSGGRSHCVEWMCRCDRLLLTLLKVVLLLRNDCLARPLIHALGQSQQIPAVPGSVASDSVHFHSGIDYRQVLIACIHHMQKKKVAVNPYSLLLSSYLLARE